MGPLRAGSLLVYAVALFGLAIAAAALARAFLPLVIAPTENPDAGSGLRNAMTFESRSKP